MQTFQPSPMGDAKVGVRGIMRDGEMLSTARMDGGDFHSAAFPVMESLTSVTRRQEENKHVVELEAEVARLLQEKKDEERRFKEELELLRKEVQKQSFKEGEEQGYARATQENAQAQSQMREELARFMQQMGEAHQDFLNQSDRTMNLLLLSALQRLTGAWAQNHGLAIERAVQACLAYLGNEHRAVLYMSEQDREWVESSLREWIGVEHSRVEFDLQFNAKMSPGSCLMETAAGSVESSAQLMLQRMEDELKQILGMDAN